MARNFLPVLYLAMSAVLAAGGDLPLIALQPLGAVERQDLERVKAGIAATYAVTVEVLPTQPMPPAAWYAPRKRHKAGAIVETLASALPLRFDKVVALTAGDISATTDEDKDWGIMGLGQLGGRACVVSTFRLRAGNADDALFRARLVKIANHELGHTFGLDHCPVAGCLMQDKRGKIAAVDAESGKPCAACAARLPVIQ